MSVYKGGHNITLITVSVWREKKTKKRRQRREDVQSAAFIKSAEANVKRLAKAPPLGRTQGHTTTAYNHTQTHNLSTYVCSHSATACVYTHVNDVGEVVDVIFEDTAVGGLESKQVLISRLDGLQLVLCVLGLSLIGERERDSRNREITRERQVKETRREVDKGEGRKRDNRWLE